MQPTTPFNTRSWSVPVCEIAGAAAVIVLFYAQRWAGLSTPARVALLVAWLGYAFMRFCGLKRWHPTAARGEGLEQQFMQVAVAAAYGFCIASLAAVLHISILIYPVAIVLAGVSAINATLILFHCKDKSTIPINYYSHRKYLQEDA